jgi:hypothetical protein
MPPGVPQPASLFYNLKSYTFQLAPPGILHVKMTPATVAVKGGNIGRKWPYIWPESSELMLLLAFFYMLQICDMGQDGFYFPSEEGVLRIFSP